MIFEKIKEVIADQMSIDQETITMDTSFLEDLGADSLDVFQIVTELEEIYEIDFDTADVEKIRTVSDAVEYIKNALE
jgi:acyl carrier protein